MRIFDFYSQYVSLSKRTQVNAIYWNARLQWSQLISAALKAYKISFLSRTWTDMRKSRVGIAVYATRNCLGKLIDEPYIKHRRCLSVKHFNYLLSRLLLDFQRETLKRKFVLKTNVYLRRLRIPSHVTAQYESSFSFSAQRQSGAFSHVLW